MLLRPIHWLLTIVGTLLIVLVSLFLMAVLDIGVTWVEVTLTEPDLTEQFEGSLNTTGYILLFALSVGWILLCILRWRKPTRQISEDLHSKRHARMVNNMKRLAVIFAFPYLAPSLVALAISNLWNMATNTPANTVRFFGGQVPAYFIFAPLALVIQIIIGLPGSFIIMRSVSKKAAILCCVVMAVLPLVLVSTSVGSGHLSLWSILPVVGIVGLFGIGSCVTFYFLRHQRLKKTEQDGGNSSATLPASP